MATTLTDRIDQFLREENPDAPLHMFKNTIAEWRDEIMGGGMVTTHQFLHDGESTLVGSSSTDDIPVGTSSGPDVLLDISNPKKPKVLEAGVYAVTATVAPVDAMTDGSAYELNLTLDAQGLAPVAVVSATASAPHLQPSSAASLTWYIPENGEINVDVANYDSSGRHFYLYVLLVQRLS
jgi:hypothetical protein